MSRRLLGCLLLLPVFGVAACGGGGGGGGGGSGSFVGRASNAAVFVQWTQNGNQITGSLQEAIEQNNPGAGNPNPDTISNDSSAFTGTVSGSSVTLSLNKGLGSVSNLTGTLNGGELDLNLPGQNGLITTVHLQTGTASDYNNDLSNLQAQIGRANAQAQQALAAQQQEATSTSTTTAPANTANLSALRQRFLAPVKASFQTANYSAAFKQCVLAKLEKVTAAQLEQFALNPSSAHQLGYQLGRTAAEQCIASGAKP